MIVYSMVLRCSNEIGYLYIMEDINQWTLEISKEKGTIVKRVQGEIVHAWKASQRHTDFAGNPYCAWREEGRRAWKHKCGNTMVDNAEVKSDAFSSCSWENLQVNLRLGGFWSDQNKTRVPLSDKERRLGQPLWFTLMKRSSELMNLYQLDLFGSRR